MHILRRISKRNIAINDLVYCNPDETKLTFDAIRESLVLLLNVKYIVSGGAGYLGTHLVFLLSDEGHDVTVFDDLSHGFVNRLPSGVEIVNVDVSDRATLEKLISPTSVDGFFHLAAKKSVRESMINPNLYEETHVLGTRNIIEFCIKNGIENFVLTSSAAVYGSLEKSGKITESDPANPISPYGLSKLKAEEELKRYVENSTIKGIALRCFNLAGTRDSKIFEADGENVIPILLRAIQKHENFKIFGSNLSTPDGTCVRDYVHVEDVAHAHLLAMKKLESDSSHQYIALNISSGRGVSILELIRKFEGLVGNQIKIEFHDPRKGDTQLSVGDNSKANLTLGWEPQYNIDRMAADSWKAQFAE